MSTTETILARIRELQDEMEEEFARRRAAFRYRFENGRVVFEAEVRRRHREMRVRLSTFLRHTRPMSIITAPVIYAMIVPFVTLDLFVTIYQAVCFPAYGIDKVRRADFIRIDRHHLAYLNALQKLNCVYCGYCNGLIGYVQEIAGRTEAYWCPIKHAARGRRTPCLLRAIRRLRRCRRVRRGAEGIAPPHHAGRAVGHRAKGMSRAQPRLRRRRITTSTAVISAPSGAEGRRAISSSSAGASLSRFSSSQKKCG